MRAALGGAILGVLVVSGGAKAQISDDVVKIAVLTDMTGVYADNTGPGAVTALPSGEPPSATRALR